MSYYTSFESKFKMDSKYLLATNELAAKLLERNYLSKDIREAFFHISNLDRDKLIPYKFKR